MIIMNTEQLRAEFEAWASQYTNYPQKYDQIPAWQAYQAGRAALQSQTIPASDWFDMFMELARAVVVANRLFAVSPTTTKQKVAADAAIALQEHARKHPALQSQDAEDTFCVWHNDPETDNSWDTGCRQLFEIYDGTPTENRMGFCCYCGKPIREAIGHARRVEGVEQS